MMTKDIIAFSS